MAGPTSARLTSRKFLLAAASLVALAVLCWFRRIDGALFVTGLTVTVGAYLTANIAQKKVQGQQ